MTVDVVDFETEVVSRSHERPVLVDFWAPWCGPCRVIGPVLEKLADESGGAWVLAKLNTDENPEISMQFGIRGIPAVKLFVDGSVTAEFTGALPEYAVRKWLDEHLPSADRDTLARAESLIHEGRLEEARIVLEDLENDEARILLARLIVFTDPTRAAELVAEIDDANPAVRSVAEAVRQIASALTMPVDDYPDGAGRETFTEAVSHLRSGRFDEGASGLISLLQKDRYYGDDMGRKLGIALFTLLGPMHEVTRAHRRMFDMYLY